MELAEYLGRIWRRKWIVLGVVILAVVLDAAVLFLIPRHYQATSVLEVGGIDSFLSNPGTARVDSSGRQTLPSAIQASTQTYLNLLNTDSVSDEAHKRAQSQLASSSNGSNLTDNGAVSTVSSSSSTPVIFSYDGRAEAVRASGTDVIYIDATSDNPGVAKAAADALATVLVERSKQLSGDVANDFVDDIQKHQLDPIDKRMSEVRQETETLKATQGGDVAARNIRIAQLDDEASSLTEARKQYTDLIARVRINEALNDNDLRLLAPAIAPASKEMPPLLRSSAVAAVVGLVIAIMVVLAVDRRKIGEPATIF